MSDRSRKGHPFGSIAVNFVSAGKPTAKPGDLSPISAGGTTVAVPGRVGKDPSGLYKLLAAVRAAGCDDVTVVVSDPHLGCAARSSSRYGLPEGQLPGFPPPGLNAPVAVRR